MADPVKLTIDGIAVEAAPGTLLIEVAREMGKEIPAFCYYEGLTQVAACRMCLVEIDGMPKLMTACTQPVGEGMVVRTETPKLAEARKGTLEFLLTNHPLDCPVCDKGGECELQDMVFRYGAAESRYVEIKHHHEEQQWSPVVYFDPARCILCYRCVRVCSEGMGVNALGIVQRGAYAEIAPNHTDHLNCDECGACIDICPVGALTSDSYRYQTRPWEMNHVGTVCTHCSNGCKTTLGVRNDQILRGNNRDRSGINGEFLCVKGRYAFDFNESDERLTTPMIRKGGKLEPASWSDAIRFVAGKFKQVADAGRRIGVVGSARTTNEENYYLQKFARQVLGTQSIDHQRSGDVVTLLDALAGRQNALATVEDLYQSKAVLVIGTDLAQQHPLLHWQIRANWRHHGAHTYSVTAGPVREDQHTVGAVRAAEGQEIAALEQLRAQLAAEAELAIVFGDSVKGDAVRQLVAFGDSLGIPVKYVCLVDYVNSRGALDMGLTPELEPGYRAAADRGMTLPQMLADEHLAALWVVNADPLRDGALAAKDAFVVVQDLFLTATAQRADVVLPSASLYEKQGTVTNVCGEVQRLKKAAQTMGAKADLEIIGLIAKEMGAAAKMGPWMADKVFTEVQQVVAGYNVPLPVLATGGAAQTAPPSAKIGVETDPALIRSARDTLFTSGTLGSYSRKLDSLLESPGSLYQGEDALALTAQ
ncbi:MAG: NADH-quinone oxidoreductase subunit NuoG [Bryobacterales bacterium]|jgi:NADH-quinone oxidoreductase subunit G|nr:NADH-quinone oxidoreductase subunit NuoG [Bryobacterales bacterium]